MLIPLIPRRDLEVRHVRPVNFIEFDPLAMALSLICNLTVSQEPPHADGWKGLIESHGRAERRRESNPSAPRPSNASDAGSGVAAAPPVDAAPPGRLAPEAIAGAGLAHRNARQ